MSKRVQFILLFLGLLALRTFFGFSQSFFTPDETQTYLIGLKAYCEHSWPYFGPDLIVTETGFYTQLPGALEGAVIGGPFYIWPAPEAPFLLLNLLSLSGLALLAWYISQRVKNISFAFTFAAMSLLPWNLHESTNIINPSWLLFGSVLFFIGFLEAYPETSRVLWSPFVSFAAMGFGLFWNMQFHFSWILMPPFLLAAVALRLWRAKATWMDLGGFVTGALFPLAFLLPTWIVFGFSQSGQGLSLSVPFSWAHVGAFFTILARYFSLVSYEVPRFLGFHTAERIQALRQFPLWVLPAVFLWIVGLLQPFALLVLGFQKDHLHKDRKSVRHITFGAFLMIWISFWFTDKEPYAHIYYVLIPLLLVYSFYIWDSLAVKKAWRVFGLVCLFASLWFDVCWAIHQAPDGSLYTGRDKVAQAIGQKDYHLLGERRPGSHN